LKICYLADARSGHTRRWVEYFAKEHEIDLITFSYTKKEDTFVPEEVYIKMGVRVHKVSKPMPFLLFAPFKIRRLIKKIKPDIVHAHYVTQYGFCGAISGFHPLIVSPWGSDIVSDPEKSKIHKFLVKYALKNADVVPAEDKVMKNRLIELKCSEGKIAPLRIASVDTNEFTPSRRSDLLQKALGTENDFLVIDTRSSAPIYHLDVFIRAIPLVTKEIPNVKFILISRPGMVRENQKIKDLVSKLDIEDRIVFLDIIPHSKMPEYLASVDLYVDTFVNIVNNNIIDKGNGIGIATLEAMACATPQILPDRIEVTSGDLYQGLTYRPLDSQDLADKIIRLLQNEKLRKQIGNKSRNAATRIVDEDVVMKDWEKLYNSLSSFS
jgi:glycosyltransferase involved in cell wall biosynthesis